VLDRKPNEIETKAKCSLAGAKATGEIAVLMQAKHRLTHQVADPTGYIITPISTMVSPDLQDKAEMAMQQVQAIEDIRRKVKKSTFKIDYSCRDLVLPILVEVALALA
jgi:hypothetical protein